jgi:hypothetical protein
MCSPPLKQRARTLHGRHARPSQGDRPTSFAERAAVRAARAAARERASAPRSPSPRGDQRQVASRPPADHPPIDLYNAISLALAIPAVLDRAKIASYAEVRHATGSETYLPSPARFEHPAPHEVDLHGRGAASSCPHVDQSPERLLSRPQGDERHPHRGGGTARNGCRRCLEAPRSGRSQPRRAMVGPSEDSATDQHLAPR